jgi:hypothetical protein
LIYSLLVIVVIGALIYWLKRWQKVPPEQRKRFLRQSGLWSLVVIIVGLILAGRAYWLMGVLAAVLALAGRAMQLAQYVPLFKKLFGEAQANPDSASAGQAKSGTNQSMSRQQAADLLGVDINASAEEIRTAHKKLMQKIHPDRGGSDALAKQINEAKRLLLK